jgi:CDP-glycerol glycerophosphotransferase (TagB/SpsB family)
MNACQKEYLLSLKEENSKIKEFDYKSNEISIVYRDLLAFDESSFIMTYDILSTSKDTVKIEGSIKIYPTLERFNIFLKLQNIKDDSDIKYYRAFTFERNKNNTYLIDEKISQGIGFKVEVPIFDITDEYIITTVLRVDNSELTYKNRTFGDYFPLSTMLKNGYFIKNDICFWLNKDELIIARTKKLTAFKKEIILLAELLKQKGKYEKRAFAARTIYDVIKHFKKSEIWIISDRINKADDNGEAFYRYIKENPQKHIKTYFVINKNSEDYSRLKKLGNIVDYNSNFYKLLFLMADKIVSAHADEFVNNRLLSMKYVYKDILHNQKFIFLQHGVIKDDLSDWLNKYNKNISMFVTASKNEYASIVNGEYYYTDNEIRLTGLPRYDYLEDKSDKNKIIVFMPTWRSFLSLRLDTHTGERRVKSNFEGSSYYLNYSNVLGNSELFDFAEINGYKIKFMIHPSMPREIAEIMKFDRRLEILDLSTRYKDLYAEANLVVTDYSSAVFDFAYLKKPVIYYQADKDEFFSGLHTYKKGYFDYEKNGFGEVKYSADELIDCIKEYIQNGCKMKDIYKKRVDDTFAYHDRNNCKRVYDEIIKLDRN